MNLKQSILLPCGLTIKNRFAKSAMSEILGDFKHDPTPEISTLYSTWSRGGAGLLISGNVMVDRSALGEPRNIVFDQQSEVGALAKWAQSGSYEGTNFWVQLNHPGKQSPRFLSKSPVAPSSIPLQGSLGSVFNTPRELSQSDIMVIIEAFSRAAQMTKNAGFHGVQIHGAHGYLVSQFLSPCHNQRSDKWGGSLENRMRFVVEIYRAIRSAVGKSFGVGIKINSADFLKGGFTEDESVCVIKTLSEEGMDLIEVSGGTYEAPVMMGRKSTQAREAYFSDFCQMVRENCKAPLMLTGGFRSARAMERCLNDGVCDLIGLARSLALEPNMPQMILAGDLDHTSLVKPLSTGLSWLDQMSMLNITWYESQLKLMGRKKKPNPNLHPLVSVLGTFISLGSDAFKKRR